jgi:hypothetical protein
MENTGVCGMHSIVVLGLERRRARSLFLGSSVGTLEHIDVRSIVVAFDCKSCAIKRTARDYDFFFSQFHPFKPHFKPRTYNTIKC